MPAASLLLLTLPIAALAGAAATPVDAGRPMPSGTPVVLVVSSPGLPAASQQGLVDALEAEGLDAWLLTLPLAQQDLELARSELLPAARAALPAADHALVGHGLGGTLAAAAAIDQPPAALGLLGAPLAFPDSAVAGWLCEQPLPAEGLDLAASTGARWQGSPVLELLLGTPLPPLERVGGAWLADLCAWRDSGEAFDLRQGSSPLWVGVGDLDELGPAERVRPWLPAHAHFLRFGLLRLDTHGYRSVDLLTDPRPARALARWLAEQLTGKAPAP